MEEGGELLHTAVLPRRLRYFGKGARIVLSVLLCLWIGHAAATAAPPRLQLSALRFTLNIPRQNLSDALKQFALQTGLQVARLNDEISDDPTVGPLVGSYSAVEALDALLGKSRFDYRVVDARTIAIVARDQPPSPGFPGVVAQSGVKPGQRPEPTDDAAASAAHGAHGSVAAADGQATPPAALDPKAEVVVTGTRIQQSIGMSSPTPVSVMSAREIESLSSRGLIDAMSLMPQFLMNSTPTNAFSFASNAGQSFLNLRGLGPNRTLVLLDGRRVVSSSRLGSTDIGVFPTALIQRIEVVTGGASAAYGSDAVGGVANFVLDTGFDGVRAEAHRGTTERGDGDNLTFSLVGGRDFGDRLHAVASVEHMTSGRIETYEGRDWFQGWGRVTNPQWTATHTGPAVLTLPNVTSTRYTFGGLINQPGSALDRLAFQPDGSAKPFQLGPIASVGGGTYSQSGGVGDNYEADRTGDGSLIPAVARGSAFAYANYEVTEDTRAFVQALYGQNKIDFVNVGAVQFGQWQATIYRDNAFLPETLRQVMESEGLQQFGFSRMGSSADVGRARSIVENDTYSFTAGLQTLSAGWRYGGYYQFGENRGDTTLHDFVRTDRLSIALDAVRDPATGAIVCRSTLFNRNNGCVPIDLFGVGRASPEAIDYVLDDKFGRVTVAQHFAEFSADGPVTMGIGAGPVLLAVGASFREDRFTQSATPSDSSIATPPNDPSEGIQGIPAAFVGSFVHQLSSFPDLSGAYTVKEGFAEARVPLYSDEHDVQHASMSLAGRYAYYSGSGGVWAWKAGLEGNITPDLRLRGTISRDTRAANLSERFDLQNRGFTARDPMFGNTVYTLSATSTGNPTVDPEKADTVTFGAVYQPARIDGLSMSLDWYSIDIKDAIGQLGPQAIVDNCFAGAADLCALITRDPQSHELVFVQNKFLNVARAKVVGADFDVQFTHDLHLLGGGAESMNARLIASWLGESSMSYAHTPKIDRAGQTGGSATGYIGLPDLQLTAALSYRNGPYQVYLQGHFIDSGVLDATLRQGIDIDDNTVSSAFYTDLRLSYSLTPSSDISWDIYARIENLFDRDPPRAADFSDFNGATHTNETLFDVLGRRYTLGAHVRF
ncbi:MAG: TonB-dependent receptor [Gammaproteobacteria bacterium]